MLNASTLINDVKSDNELQKSLPTRDLQSRANNFKEYIWMNCYYGWRLLPRLNRGRSLAMTITLIINEKGGTSAPPVPMSHLSLYTCSTPSLRGRKYDDRSNLIH